MTNDGGGSGAPRFDVVLRGYDRRQVDEHVARMQRIIGRMRADLELARSQPLPIVAPAAGPIDQNSRPAPRPRPHPGDSADVVGTFSDRMQTILSSAEEEAAEIRKKAHASARSELQAARAEVADLARQRDVMVTELSRLRGQLENMLSGPTTRMAPVARNGAPSPTRRDGRPRPSPTPRSGSQPSPSPVARQTVTGPQQVPPPPPKPVSDPSVTAAAPAVADEPAAPVEAAGNGAVSDHASAPTQPEDATATAVVRVAGEPRGKVPPGQRDADEPVADDPRSPKGDDRPTVDATVKVAAVRPEDERPDAEADAETDVHIPSRSR